MSQFQAKKSQLLLNLQKLIIDVFEFAKEFTFHAILTNSQDPFPAWQRQFRSAQAHQMQTARTRRAVS
ncbi:MAG: hypothetical protein IV103_16960 [Zoogloea sp.]|nr:hypothetical protein [Zoogloea sp.]